MRRFSSLRPCLEATSAACSPSHLSSFCDEGKSRHTGSRDGNRRFRRLAIRSKVGGMRGMRSRSPPQRGKLYRRDGALLTRSCGGARTLVINQSIESRTKPRAAVSKAKAQGRWQGWKSGITVWMLMTFSKTLSSSPSPLLVLFIPSVSLSTWPVFALRF